MKTHILILASLFILTMSCNEKEISTKKNRVTIAHIDTLLNNWHKAAANAQFDEYFKYMTKQAVYIGTDPTENWQLSEFKKFCKPYFDKGKAWNFTALDRHIYFNEDSSTIWFDELLNTQMKICRGSGILIIENGEWKIAHYVLSMTIPNDNTDDVVKIKSVIEERLIDSLKK
ncbi:MAG TPA: nuclear transport factor 2 family protein [Chitinophagaceae bacterium]|nr:nuclear transport factor 2 family protein [Chitinophagaceae bacterium]